MVICEVQSHHIQLHKLRVCLFNTTGVSILRQSYLHHLQVFEHVSEFLQRCGLITGKLLTDRLVVFLQFGVRLIGFLEELQRNNNRISPLRPKVIIH